MKSINVQHHHVELYVTGKNFIVGEIAEAREYFDIPFISVYLDLIKSKTSNMKFLALRVCFNMLRRHNIGYNLAVRHFAPTAEERTDDRLSVVLHEWAQGVLREFGIDVERDILTSSSDSGSDVKRTLQTLMAAWWEWCISHLSHLALTDAFGTSIDPQQCKNDSARTFFKIIKKVIESVNKSEYLQAAFESAMLEQFEVYLKLLNAPQHRWSATALVLERLLLCWEAVKLAFLKCNRPFPLSDADRDLCIEFYSVINPVREVQLKAQAMRSFVVVDVYLGLYELYTTVLDIYSPLQLLVPTRAVIGVARTENESRPADQLQEGTRRARLQARKAFSTRYFDRYHPIAGLRQPKRIYTQRNGTWHLAKLQLTDGDFKFSYLIDAQCVLFPPMASGVVIRRLIDATAIEDSDVPLGWTVDLLREQHFRFIMQFIWEKIRGLAETVAQHVIMQKLMEDTSNAPGQRSAPPPHKRAKTTMGVLAGVLNRAAGATGERPAALSAAQKVEEEIKMLKQIGDDEADWPEPGDLWQWWARQHKRLPSLTQAAMAILANKPSSGGLECDLGAMCEVLAPKRSSLRAGMVEVNMFLKLNKRIMPTNPDDVIRLDKKTWKDSVPHRPAMSLYDEPVTQHSDEDSVVEIC